MRATEFIVEAFNADNIHSNNIGESSNLTVAVDDRGQRLFYSAKFRVEKMNWLQKSTPDTVYGQATVDLNEKSAYINRIDVHRTGNGFGTELLQYILQDLKGRGITIATVYIEHSNIASKSLFKKFGFEEGGDNKDGQYYILHL